MEDTIYFDNILNEKITIYAHELNKTIHIEDNIKQKLVNKLEGKCIRQGYVKPNSIQILNRSIGQVLDGHFNGDIVYKVKIQVSLCNPVEGQIVRCCIHNINKMGIIASLYENPSHSPLQILIARHHHQENELYKELDVGNYVHVEIIGKKFQLNDTKIHTIGQLIDTEKLNINQTPKIGGLHLQDINITDKEKINQQIHLIHNYFINHTDDLIEDFIKQYKITKEEWNSMNEHEKFEYVYMNFYEDE